MASFGSMEILDALMLSAKGKSKTAALKVWEVETILHLGWVESAWIRLPIAERYRKLVGHKLSGWLASLEQEEELRKIQAKSGGK